MKATAKKICVLGGVLPALALSGCISFSGYFGTKIRVENIPRIENGVTTREQVMSWFGPPSAFFNPSFLDVVFGDEEELIGSGAVVLALAAGLYLRPAGEPAASGAPELAVRTAPQQESGPGDTLDSLIAISQQLEGRVRLYRSEVGGMPSNDLVYQVELEDLIAQVDGELMMNPESVGLWNQRVVLLTDLSRLYENRLRRDYRQMASL